MAGIGGAPGVQWRGGAGTFHDQILVDWYEETLVDARNNVTAWWDMIQTNDKNVVGGKWIVWPAQEGRNEGTGYQDARGFLPDPGFQKFKTHTQKIEDFYGRIKIDGKTWRHAMADKGTYLDVVDTEMQGSLIDASIDWQFAAWGDGTGAYAEVNMPTPANPLVLQLPNGVANITSCSTDPTQWLFPRMRVMFLTNAGATPVTKVIQSVDSATTITVGLTFGGGGDVTGIADGDWVCKATRELSTSALDSSYRRTCMGMEAFFDTRGVRNGAGLTGGPAGGSAQTGTYDDTIVASEPFQGVASAGDPVWNQAILIQSTITPGTAAAITEARMQSALTAAEKRNNANVAMLISSYESYDAYMATLLGSKRYVNTTTLPGGHSSLTFNEIPWYKDKDAWRGRVYFIDPTQLVRKEVEPVNWLNKAGSIWRQVVDKDEWEAAFNLAHNMVVKLRERLGAVLLDVTD